MIGASEEAPSILCDLCFSWLGPMRESYDLFYVYLLTKGSDTILADHYHTANMELLLDLKP